MKKLISILLVMVMLILCAPSMLAESEQSLTEIPDITNFKFFGLSYDSDKDGTIDVVANAVSKSTTESFKTGVKNLVNNFRMFADNDGCVDESDECRIRIQFYLTEEKQTQYVYVYETGVIYKFDNNGDSATRCSSYKKSNL